MPWTHLGGHTRPRLIAENDGVALLTDGDFPGDGREALHLPGDAADVEGEGGGAGGVLAFLEIAFEDHLAAGGDFKLLGEGIGGDDRVASGKAGGGVGVYPVLDLFAGDGAAGFARPYAQGGGQAVSAGFNVCGKGVRGIVAAESDAQGFCSGNGNFCRCQAGECPGALPDENPVTFCGNGFCCELWLIFDKLLASSASTDVAAAVFLIQLLEGKLFEELRVAELFRLFVHRKNYTAYFLPEWPGTFFPAPAAPPALIICRKDVHLQ